jgi:hypothetical protein
MMNQEIIVYIILAVTVGFSIFFYSKKKKVKKAPAGNNNCSTGGCSGCALKDHCN